MSADGPAGEWASPGQAALAGAGVCGALPSPRALGSASRPADSPGDSRESREILAGFRPKGKLRCVAVAGVPSSGWCPDLLGHAAGLPLSVASSSGLPFV